MLPEYDQSIVGITQRLNNRHITRREAPVAWKYCQYLALPFTEICLDRDLRDPRALFAGTGVGRATLRSALTSAAGTRFAICQL